MEARVMRAADEIVLPALRAEPRTLRRSAVWSLRALLAVVVFATFAAATPAAPRVALMMASGAQALRGAGLGIGWLSAAIAYASVTTLGTGSLAALGALALVLTLSLVEVRARRRSGEVISIGAAILCAFGFLDAMQPGGGAAQWTCAALLLLLFERRGYATAAAATLVAVVWCNLSPMGALAAVLALAVAAGRTLDVRRASEDVRVAWLTAAGTLLALFATPSGAAFPALAREAARLDRSLGAIVRLNPHDVAPAAYGSAFLLIVAAFALLGLRSKRVEDALPLLAAFGLALADGATLPLFCILATPLVAEAVHHALPQFEVPPNPRVRLTDALIAALAVALATTFTFGINGLLRDADSLRPAPAATIERLAASGRHRLLFCSAVEWCDYAAGYSGLTAYVDDRLERASPERRAAQAAIARARDNWRQLLAHSEIDAMLVRRGDGLATLLARSPRWDVADGDGTAVLFLRAGR